MNRADLEGLSREQLIELVLDLARQMADLKARLELPTKTPENSSVPPSQGRKPSVRGKRKRRRKGRPGVARALDPNPTALREVRAVRCPHCQGDVAAAAQAPCESYDHIELPPIRPEVTRVTLLGGTCPHCARAFKAGAPEDMAPGSPFGPNDERGIFKTTDGGKTWKKTLFVNNETGGRDIEVDWENPDVLYAAMYKGFRKGWDIISGGPASEGGIFKSIDGGETWKKMSAGLPDDLIGKIDIDIARSNPKVLYAMVEGLGPKGGLYRSNDAGESWSLLSPYLPPVRQVFFG